MESFKHQITLQITFHKEIETNETQYSPQIFFNSNTQTVINNSDVNDKYVKLMSSVQKWPGGGSGWLIELVDGNYINIYVYNSLADKFIHIIA